MRSAADEFHAEQDEFRDVLKGKISHTRSEQSLRYILKAVGIMFGETFNNRKTVINKSEIRIKLIR